MISIKRLASAASARQYFSHSDYYALGTDEKDITSSWFGKGADALQLQGEVDLAAFERILDGELPGGIQLGRAGSDGKFEHAPGWDFTLSAPKSVSVLGVLGGDTRLLYAVQEAAQEAIGYLEAELVFTRVKSDGEITPEHTENIVAAQFLHTTTRALDPGAHVHTVVANATRRSDGEWRSIESSEMYEFSKMVGQIFQNELATRVKDLGYEISPNGNGTFEIASVPRDVIRQFSKRREEIESFVKEHGLEGAKAFEDATLATRNSKVKVGRAELAERWNADLEAVRFDPQRAIDASYSAATREVETVASSARESVEFAYQNLATREAVFSRRELIHRSMEWGRERHPFSEVSAAVQELVEEKRLLPIKLGFHGGKNHAFTTPEAVRMESRTLKYMRDGKGRVAPILQDKRIDGFLSMMEAEKNSDSGAEKASDEFAYTKGQRDAVRTILTAKDQFVAIQGLPGTGKTTMLEAVVSAAQERGYSVRGLAPTGNAAQTLESETRMPSQTLASHLGFLENARRLPRASHELWVVDEGSMVGGEDMAKLLLFARTSGARVALVGDTHQLSAIGWGRPFYQLLRGGIAHAQMTDIRRQRNEHLREAVISSLKRDVEGAFSKLSDSIIELPDTQDRLDAVTKLYMSYSPKEREQTLIMIPDNKSREIVNRAVRQALREEGSVGMEESSFEALPKKSLSFFEKKNVLFYDIGDVVKFPRTYKSLGVQRGEFASVEGVDRTHNIVQLRREDGSLVEWDPESAGVSKKESVEVFRSVVRSISEGDRIRWRDNDKGLDLKNGDVGRIVEIKGPRVLIDFGSDGAERLVHVDFAEKKHWDLAYASTGYAQQGETAERNIALLESHQRRLVNQETFTVALSRAQDEFIAVVDDKEKVEKQLKRNLGQKTSALDHREDEEKKFWGRGGALGKIDLSSIEATKKSAEKIKEAIDDQRLRVSEELELSRGR